MSIRTPRFVYRFELGSQCRVTSKFHFSFTARCRHLSLHVRLSAELLRLRVRAQRDPVCDQVLPSGRHPLRVGDPLHGYPLRVPRWTGVRRETGLLRVATMPER